MNWIKKKGENAKIRLLNEKTVEVVCLLSKLHVKQNIEAKASQCPLEKEKLAEEALRHFKMIS